jgi:DNA-binding SARP family transcriptional activator/tetratricopeptide (TPR) repeat protein
VIQVRLLGPPRVERDGAPVVFDTRKALALLAHLSLSEGARPRDALADLLWTDTDLAHARGALRRTLSALRTGLGADHLESSRDQVRLVRGDDLAVDVDVFRRCLAEGDGEGALETYGGDLLEGLVLRDAPDFEEWWEVEAAALRRELTTVLGLVAAEREAGGDLAGALAVVRRWVAQDPLHEPAHQALIRLLARTGDRGGALVQYRECVRTLSRELGVPPLRETTELYEAVNLGTFVTAPVSVPEPDPVPVPRAVPLVARERELDLLTSAYDAVGTPGGPGRVALVEGEPGIGRTRLVRELAERVHASGAVVLGGRSYEEEAHLPYRPVIDMVRARLREDVSWLDDLDLATLAEAARLVPELADALPPDRRLPAAPSPEAPGAESRFLGGLWETLSAAAAGETAGLLVLDDAQWADEATLGLVSFGLRRLADRPLLVVLVWLAPYEHQVRSAAASAARDDGAVVTLGRLDEEAVGQLVAELRSEDVDPAVVHRYWETTEGVPRLLVEYLRAADAGLAMPAGVRAALLERLSGVGETARQLLSTAAVIGRSFDVETLRSVSGRTDEETVTALEEVVGQGLVREGAAAYDFDHGLLRAVVYDGTSLARRRLLHGRAAAVVGLAPAARARHLQLAGQDTAAAEAFRVAGDLAREVFAHAEALAHYTAALDLGHSERSVLEAARADVQVVLGDYAGALVSLEDAAAAATPSELPGIELRLGRLHARRGEHTLADAHYAAALEGMGDEPGARAEVVADRALAALSLADQDRARILASEAVVLATAADDQHASCRAHHLLGLIAASDGDLEGALDELQHSVDLARALGDEDLEVAALNNLALAHRSRGELVTATDLTREALGTCTRLGDRHREAALENNLADLLHAQGQGDEAMTHLKRAVEIFAEVGDRDELRPAIWQLVRW